MGEPQTGPYALVIEKFQFAASSSGSDVGDTSGASQRPNGGSQI